MSIPPPAPPAKSRGRLVTPRQVSEEFFPKDQSPSLRWLRENLPGSLRIARRVYWHERDVEDALLSLREDLP